ncbi:MAG: translation elongation factor Ts [Acidobacteriota bacterium]|nr:MAG: translation elongation factor Ts [Acidobacteriota bacterium]
MAVTAQDVKKLREMTGAGMMDCKKALLETGGDFDQAVDFLRKKGLAKAAGKAGRATREGGIYSYIHAGNRVGVLLELNCETDFVARTDEFQALAKGLAMHIAAARPRFVRREDVDEATLEREREIYREQMKDSGKPPQVIDKIVEGKLNKFFEEACLLEQVYLIDPEAKKKVQEVIHEAVAKLGENIQVARFARFELGETA